MEGEVVRDSILFLAGRLDPTIGGPDQPVASAEAGTRRTIYYRYASGDNIPLLSMFDAANVTECYRRHETIVPQQALALTNSGMVLTRAGDIASVIDSEVGGEPSARAPSSTRPSSASSAGCRPRRSGPSARRASPGWPRRSRRRGRTPPRRKPGPARHWSTCC